MRRATSLTDAPGANASATIARFCSSLHRRRRSGPHITSTRLIAQSFAPVQNTSLAPVPERAGSIPRAQGGRYRTVTFCQGFEDFIEQAGVVDDGLPLAVLVLVVVLVKAKVPVFFVVANFGHVTQQRRDACHGARPDVQFSSR